MNLASFRKKWMLPSLFKRRSKKDRAYCYVNFYEFEWDKQIFLHSIKEITINLTIRYEQQPFVWKHNERIFDHAYECTRTYFVFELYI